MAKQVPPISRPIAAKPHRPVYRMHRYFARRPYSVFANLVAHYSAANDVVLDPFAGGGVTLVEGVLQGRRVIGFDTNPLAVFISRMELLPLDSDQLEAAIARVVRAYRESDEALFSTQCRRCGAKSRANWFEYSHLATCKNCRATLFIQSAEKVGPGIWKCRSCHQSVRFSPRADSPVKIVSVSYSCDACGISEVAEPSQADARNAKSMPRRLRAAERRGLWLPNVRIPACNMERESALHKKGYTSFRQFFTDRHLLALGELRRLILEEPSPAREWLLFAFSSTLRYTNKMVTRNPAWRRDRPLEWAKPGFWLPSVFVEANPLEEFSRRCAAITRGKKDYHRELGGQRVLETEYARQAVAGHSPCFHVSTRSSTHIPLDDGTVDVIVTDPPYGSYVHYADLSNFWSAWLHGVPGLGGAIDTSEEAVIARKRFPGAKGPREYQLLLEKCFAECARVLRPHGYMVLTFNNREPRAWGALLIAASKAGFTLPANGVMFQDGIAGYKHTAQSRRAGSMIGDFIFSFQKRAKSDMHAGEALPHEPASSINLSDQEYIELIDAILDDRGPLTPNSLFTELYLRMIPLLLKKVVTALRLGDAHVEDLLRRLDEIELFDSHRRHQLEKNFGYSNGMWFKDRAA